MLAKFIGAARKYGEQIVWVLFAGMVVGLLHHGWTHDSAASSPLIGRQLNVRFTSIDGSEVNLDRLSGHVVLIDFWATWCGPCMRELQEVKEVYATWHDKGFEIIGINLDQSKEILLSVLKREHIPWPQYFEEDGGPNRFAVRYGVDRIPTMWLIDKKGVFREIVARGKVEKQVRKLIRQK